MEDNFVQKNKYAQVIVDIAGLDTRTFSYLMPEELQNNIQIGIPVLVPFGTHGVINAYVVGFTNYLPEHIKAKSIYELLDNKPLFNLEYLQFIEWVSNYYCANLPTVLSTALPLSFYSKTQRVVSINDDKNLNNTKLNKVQGLLLEIIKNAKNNEITQATLQRKAKVPSARFFENLRKLQRSNIIKINSLIEVKNQKHKTEKYVKLLTTDNLNKRQAEVLELLEAKGGELKHSEFVKLAKTTPATLKKLHESKNIEIYEREIYRNPLKVFETKEREEFFTLNQYQQRAYEYIAEAIEQNDSNPQLLFGVTGSGKTEVYLHAMNKAIAQGKTVMFLVPEIALASQLAKRVTARFGVDVVAIWHSNLSDGERFDVWEKIREDKIKIVIGARSAVFAPIKNIGLIVIDEEHESSYKQTSPVPRYNAKTLAEELAKRSGAALVLGSATPDVNTYYKASNTNKILSLPERAATSHNLPRVVMVDLKHESNRFNKSIYSKQLQNAIKENLEAGKQSIILLNRRGFSTYTFCEGCGYTAECKKCSIPLILHKTNSRLRCHYCNYEQPVFTACPECGSDAIRHQGMGTQKAEMEFMQLFPEAKAARIDSDVMSKKDEYIKVLDSFTRGDIDVLIGTQMIAKGLDIHNVTLVGVLSADSLFNIPDFRAEERGFQLLTQVAGRAGRGDFRGKVYFQTYIPDFFTLNTAKNQDFITFYNVEVQKRYEFDYPPFSQIIRLIISTTEDIRTQKFALDVAFRLNEHTKKFGIDEKLEVLGPSPCIIGKIKGEYRYQIIIKNRLGDKGHSMISSYIKGLNVPQDVKFLVDVDPYDML